MMLKIRDARFAYTSATIPVVNDLTDTFSPGQSVMIVGDNGTGKSTLGKLICGIIMPSKGEITVSGLFLYKLSPQKRIHLAYYINQINQLQFLHGSLKAEIKAFEKLSGGSFNESIYKSFFLPPDLECNPFELSVSQAWRFSLFLTTILNPHVLFVDEIPSPTNERNLNVLRKLLERRKAENGITFFSYQRKINLDFDKLISLDTITE
jgi:ABC-type multidrug transport system ATPase subunit